MYRTGFSAFYMAVVSRFIFGAGHRTPIMCAEINFWTAQNTNLEFNRAPPKLELKSLF